jgi:hypothetical protein
MVGHTAQKVRFGPRDWQRSGENRFKSARRRLALRRLAFLRFAPLSFASRQVSALEATHIYRRRTTEQTRVGVTHLPHQFSIGADLSYDDEVSTVILESDTHEQWPGWQA